MSMEVWAENKLFRVTHLIDDDDYQAMSDKIMNAARKHGITIWFED